MQIFKKSAFLFMFCLTPNTKHNKLCPSNRCSDGEMVDTRDLKSLARKGVLVRVQFRANKNLKSEKT